MDQGDAVEGDLGREKALAALNVALAREGYVAFYGEDRLCYLRHIATNTIAVPGPNPHRPFSAAELKKRDDLTRYLDSCSEDELIEEVLLPLFRQLGFHRITASGHKDKALEYGKDIWMRTCCRRSTCCILDCKRRRTSSTLPAIQKMATVT
jgi:hypothetical protein